MEGKGGAHERDGRAHNGGWPPDFTAWTPSDWSAFGTCATFAVAFVAAIYAKGQLAEARTLRKEQAQPYVAVYMQASPGHQRQIDLVVRNFGATVAKDVQVLIHPPPERSGVGGGTRETLWLPDAIPALAPNQEWRTWWDDGPTRFEEGLPERHEATVTCSDSHANRMEPIAAVLDWGAYKQAHYVTTHGIHEVATALRQINRTTKSWG